MTTATDDPGPLLTARSLTRDYGGGAGVFDVDLEVRRGGVCGLVGLNGAGKTTLLMMLAGLRRPDSGEIVSDLRPAEVALCPDVPEFEPWLTAAEVVGLAGRLVKARGGTAQVDGLLARVGLADAAGRRTRGFSRGMKQRLGLAAALVGDPRLLILDEPASGLDPQGRADVLTLVADLADTTTVVFSSHLLDDVEQTCDRVTVLNSGRLAYQGAVRDLMTRHVTPTWHVGVRGAAEDAADLLGSTPWAVRCAALDADTVVVEAETQAAGEHGIPSALVAAGYGMSGMYPQGARLESAFMSLTRGERP